MYQNKFYIIKRKLGVALLSQQQYLVIQVLTEHYLDHHDACIDITIPNVLPEALRCILDFLYCGSIGIPPAIRESVLEAANILQIKNFIDYYPTSVKLGLYENENTTPGKNYNASRIKKLDIPIQKQEKGTKRICEEKSTHSSLFKAAVQVKEEPEADEGSSGGADVRSEAGRGRRKVKSKYSTDIYEVSLPKMRKWKRRKINSFLEHEKEKMVQNPSEVQQNYASQEPEKDTVLNVLSSVMDMDQETSQHKREKTCALGEVPKDFTTDSLPSLIGEPPPPSPAALLFTEKEGKILTSEVPLTLASTPSSSVIMPHIFVASQPYLSDSTTKPEPIAEMSCPPAIVQEDSVALNERSLEPPSADISSIPPTSMFSGVKELPLMAPRSSIANFPQKISEAFHVKNEEEQEDGLFKFQVWR